MPFFRRLQKGTKRQSLPAMLRIVLQARETEVNLSCRQSIKKDRGSLSLLNYMMVLIRSSKTILDTTEKADEIVLDMQNAALSLLMSRKSKQKKSIRSFYHIHTAAGCLTEGYGFSGKRTMSLAQKLYEEGFLPITVQIRLRYHLWLSIGSVLLCKKNMVTSMSCVSTPLSDQAKIRARSARSNSSD